MILVIAFTEADGGLNRGALECVGAAKAAGGFCVGLVGAAADAGALAGCGAAKVYAVTGEAFGQARYSTDAAACEAIARASGADVILSAQSSRSARALPGVAARLGGRADTHVTSFDAAAMQAGRWFYRQRIEAVLTRAERPWVLLLESGCAEAWQGASGDVAVESVAVEVAPRSNVVGTASPRSDQQTIRPDARLLFVAGAGWTKKQKDGAPHVDEAGRLILGFLASADASLGSSKSLVDLSGEGNAVLPFLSHMNQVGQTGATPRHPKGLATCCHGEEPHVVGWRFVQERRAINLDANCGWARGKADVVYVADAFDVMTEVNRLLSS